MKLSAQTNGSWLYEKAYFKDLEWDKGEDSKVNEKVLEARNLSLYALQFRAPEPRGNVALLKLQTTYPGMLTGAGYPHEMGFKGELKLGFSFDYTTGLPYLPGSSVKGILRNPFRSETGKVYLESVLKEILGASLKVVQEPIVETQKQDLLIQLEKELFEGTRLERSSEGEVTYKPYPLSQRDIFYDAFVQGSKHQSSNPDLQGAYLGPDYITPHINRKDESLSPFTNPIPISFLKVLPRVTFGFDFRLFGSKVLPQLTANKKLDLFKRILLDFGVGAKTNVGYGQLEDPENPMAMVDMESLSEVSQNDSFIPEVSPSLEEEPPSRIEEETKKFSLSYLPLESIRRGKRIQALVKAHQGNRIILTLGIDGYKKEVPVRAAAQLFPIGTLIEVTVNNISGKGDRLSISVDPPNPNKDIISKTN